MPLIKFPTSDEDSSTPDPLLKGYVYNVALSFRPLTRIHLLLTNTYADRNGSNSKFPTSDEDSSTPDQVKEHQVL